MAGCVHPSRCDSDRGNSGKTRASTGSRGRAPCECAATTLSVPAKPGESRLRRGAPPRAGRANQTGLTGTVTVAGGALVPARNVIYVTRSDLLFLAHPGQIRPDPARTTCSAARIVPPVGTDPGMPLNGPWKPRRATIVTHACTHASYVAFVSPRRFWGVFPGQPPKTRKTRQLYQNRNTGQHNNIHTFSPES